MKVPHTKKAVFSTLLAVPLLFTGVVFATGNYNNDHNNCKDNTVTLSSVQTDGKSKENKDKDKDCKPKCQPVVTSSVTKGDEKEGHSKDCPTPPTDVCNNIDGAQATVPEGYTVADGVCTKTEVPVVTPPVVTPTTPTATTTTTPTVVETAPADSTFQGK